MRDDVWSTTPPFREPAHTVEMMIPPASVLASLVPEPAPATSLGSAVTTTTTRLRFFVRSSAGLIRSRRIGRFSGEDTAVALVRQTQRRLATKKRSVETRRFVAPRSRGWGSGCRSSRRVGRGNWAGELIQPPVENVRALKVGSTIFTTRGEA